jgi:hypothetical protein
MTGSLRKSMPEKQLIREFVNPMFMEISNYENDGLPI